MIGISGQYIFSFRVGDLEDFIDQPDLSEFLIVEEAGNLLPEFRLGFYTTDESLLRVLNESNDLEVTFGEDFSNSYSAKLFVINAEMIVHGNGKRGISITGLLSAVEYISNKKLTISPEKSGIETVIDNIKENKQFILRTPDQPDPTTNIAKSEDLQRWIQPNTSDKLFISDILLHSYMTESFIMSGISSDNRFIIKDMKKLLEEDFKWKFTSTPEEDRDITYDPSPAIKTSTGFNNYLAGYGRKDLVYNIEAGSSEIVSADSSPLMALTKDLPRRSTMDRRFHSLGISSDNIHDKYHQAAIQNITGSVVTSNIKVLLSFSKFFKPVRILDLVMFSEGALNSKGQGESSDLTSGLYIVSKVARSLLPDRFVTSIEMVRESLNQVKGDTKQNTELEKSFFAPENLPEEETDEAIPKDQIP